MVDTFDKAVAATSPLEGFGHDEEAMRSLAGSIVATLRLTGAASGADLAEMLRREPDSEFQECIDALIVRGDVVRHDGIDRSVYVTVEACVHRLAGQSIHVGPRDGATLRGDASSDDAETLDDLLGPPSWRYAAATLTEYVRWSDGSSFGRRDGWVALAESGSGASILDHLPEKAPEQIRRLAALTAEWTVAARSALDEPLRIWAGLGEDMREDPAQARIATLPSTSRTVVSAGPGTGKTHTIRERLSHLVEAGIPAPSITVIAYSRAAVAELHARVPVMDGEIVDIRTMDSIAGLFVAHATEDIGDTDYESTIRQAIELVSRDDRTVRRWLETRRHLILDEAQDLVGLRRTFLTMLLNGLPEECGVTVFADPAQAIHGYGERQAGRPDPVPIDKLLGALGFEKAVLGRNHRTMRPTLQRIASEGRRILSESKDGHAALREMRHLVSRLADGAPPGPTEARPLATLALFRGRAAAARHAARMGDVGVRVRLAEEMNDVELATAPGWLGRTMADLQGRGADALAAAVAADPSLPPASTLADALAVSLIGGRYDTARMAEALRAGRAPTVDPSEAAVASTIHAAKGHEADEVELHLPEPREDMSQEEADEEARVLYVGATRARRRLYLAPETGTMRREGTRFWRVRANGLQVQVRMVDAMHALVLAEPDGPIRTPLLRWTLEGGWGLHADGRDGDQRLSSFGKEFHRDLAAIRDRIGSPRFAPAARGRLRAEWRTLAHGDTLVVAPVAEGFVWINFLRARTS